MTERPIKKEGRGAFLPGTAQLFPSALGRLSLQEVHEIRLLLRGDSAIDWHRLGLRDLSDVRRLLSVNGIDITQPGDLTALQRLRSEAAEYIRDVLGLRLSDHVASEAPATEVFLLASSRGRYQREACTLLKTMHISYHLEARELRMALPIPDSELFSMVEQSVVSLFDELRAAGVPVVEFAWSRKTKDSLITKLLVKREVSAAQVFDRLRFRLIVDEPRDVLPTLHVMLQRFIPFNYVVPGQSVNTLVDPRHLERRLARTRDFSIAPRPVSRGLSNEFSGSGYQILNVVADLPVRVDEMIEGTELEREGRAAVVFVLAEFQIVDRARSAANETGENSHAQYKHRQYQRVRERLLREPKKAEKSDKR